MVVVVLVLSVLGSEAVVEDSPAGFEGAEAVLFTWDGWSFDSVVVDVVVVVVVVEGELVLDGAGAGGVGGGGGGVLRFIVFLSSFSCSNINCATFLPVSLGSVRSSKNCGIVGFVVWGEG